MSTQLGHDNRRSGVRYPVSMAIRFSCLAQERTGHLVNVSAKGCCVVSRNGTRGLTAGKSFVIVWMKLPGESTTIRVNPARVRWIQDDRFGLEFIAAKSADFVRIERFLNTLAEPESR